MSIVTRFPPEPSGYLHLGHLKAIFTNLQYAEKGSTLLRFDDTNPAKSNQEYVDGIIEDLKTMQIFDRFSSVTYTSDYFDKLQEYATQLIQNGLAYVDFSAPDEISKAKEDEVATTYRDNNRETNLISWGKVLRGERCEVKKTQGVLRLKIDLHHKNKCMRDPIIYRVIADTPHYRTKTLYQAYPVYDFACPIVDSLEGVTHILRTPQFKDKDQLHSWILSHLKLRIPKMKNYSKMNFTRTILSKRVINRLIEKGVVAGPLDPRLDTVKGLLRRGLTLDALQKFFGEETSVNARSINLDWHKLYNYNRKDLNEKAYRLMAIFDKDKYQCEIDFSGKIDKKVHFKWKENGTHFVSIPVNPLQARQAKQARDKANSQLKKPDDKKIVLDEVKGAFHQLRNKQKVTPASGIKKRNLTIDKNVYLDSKDANLFRVGDYVLLINWITIQITGIDTTSKKITAKPVIDIDIKDIPHKVSWVSSQTGVKVKTYYFDHLIEKEDLTDEESKEIEKHINPKSETIMDVWVDDSFTSMSSQGKIGKTNFSASKPGFDWIKSTDSKKKYYQLMRIGFFIHDATGFLFYIKEPNHKKQFLLNDRISFLK